MLLAEKAIAHGGPQIEYGTEKPRYRQLRTAIQAYYGDLLPPLEELREQVLLLAGLQAAEELGGTFSLSTEQRARINAEVERFLVQLAGPDRTREGFVVGGIGADEADGIIQQRNVLTYAVGLQRGARLLDADTTLTAGRQDPAVQAMLDRAFERLSKNGEMRMNGIKDDVQSVLVSATDAGLSPMETARQMNRLFNGDADHKESYRQQFEVIARTESAYAAIEGTRNQLADFGVVAVEWLIDVSACERCQLRVGQVYSIEDVGNHPPEHPNCLCDLSPILAGGERQ